MIGLDTNVVIRYLAQDDPAQSRKASLLFERELSEADPGFVSVVTIAETAWVLARAYGLTDCAIASAIESMLQIDSVIVECEQEVFTAMIALKAGLGSFADALIGAFGAKTGCPHTLTFDEKAAKLPGFAAL